MMAFMRQLENHTSNWNSRNYWCVFNQIFVTHYRYRRGYILHLMLVTPYSRWFKSMDNFKNAQIFALSSFPKQGTYVLLATCKPSYWRLLKLTLLDFCLQSRTRRLFDALVSLSCPIGRGNGRWIVDWKKPQLFAVSEVNWVYVCGICNCN